MALVFAAPLVSKLCLRRSTHELKAIHRKVPNLGMCRQRNLRRASMDMSSTTYVSNDDGVQRRIAGHHPNLWDDNLIDSLSTSYEAPYYAERANRLVGDIKDIFNSMAVEDREFISPLNDLLQRLWIVDSVERLGIDRHFKNEIKSALDYVYRSLYVL